MRAVEHVEASVIDHSVGEEVAQRHARLKRAVPIRCETVRREIQDGDRGPRPAPRQPAWTRETGAQRQGGGNEISAKQMIPLLTAYYAARTS